MIRAQIQIPDGLYAEVQRVAREQEWSIAEVMRRGAEEITRVYPSFKKNGETPWKLPPAITSRLLVQEPQSLRDAIREDQEFSA
jgi:hypothetical protein